MKLTQEQLAKAKAAKSVEELLTLAKENGMELTEEEAKNYFEQWHKDGKLSDEELDNVSGGCGGDPHDDYPSGACFSYTSEYITDTKCPICGEEMTDAGRVFILDKYVYVYRCGKSGSLFRLIADGNPMVSPWYWNKV